MHTATTNQSTPSSAPSSFLNYLNKGVWTVFYFIYFLFKGKPEWKCEAIEQDKKNCCVDCKQPNGGANHKKTDCNNEFHYSNTNNTNAKPYFATDTLNNHPAKPFSTDSTTNNFAAKPSPYQPSLLRKSSDAVATSASRGAEVVRNAAKATLRVAKDVVLGTLSVLKTFFTSSPPSKPLPPIAAPKPFRPISSEDNASPSYNKVAFEPLTKEETPDDEVTVMAPPPWRPQPVVAGNDFITSNVANDTIGIGEEQKQLPAEPAVVQPFVAPAVAPAVPVAPVLPTTAYTPFQSVEPVQQQAPPPPPPVPAPRNTLSAAPNNYSEHGSFYSERVNNHGELLGEREQRREPSIPPPAPPPPPAKPIRIPNSVDREMTKTPLGEKKENKGMGLPADVMAELAENQRLRQERAQSQQRDLTQSCHPDMPEWRDRLDRSATSTPWRSTSVGPTMRRLEQVVKRLDNNEHSDDEATFVFRPKDRNYAMGRSVFTPVEEAEQWRDDYNRKSVGGYEENGAITPSASSRCQTPHEYAQYRDDEGLRKRSRTVGPRDLNSYSSYSRDYDHDSNHNYVPPVSRPYTPSAAYSNAPFTSHTARAKTPVGFDRGVNFAYDRDGVSQGTVDRHVSRWPPVSNATGAPVEKDHWIKNVMAEQDEGLVTTMCRRVVERKSEDNWKWRDENGQLLDEQNQNTWKGELDTVLRDGPNQGRHWSRTVELLPTGDTRFQDISRQFNNDYVIESVVRNY